MSTSFKLETFISGFKTGEKARCLFVDYKILCEFDTADDIFITTYT